MTRIMNLLTCFGVLESIDANNLVDGKKATPSVPEGPKPKGKSSKPGLSRNDQEMLRMWSAWEVL